MKVQVQDPMADLLSWAVETSVRERDRLAKLLHGVCERIPGSRHYRPPPNGCEWLDCQACGARWARMVVRGVKPHVCPRCRASECGL